MTKRAERQRRMQDKRTKVQIDKALRRSDALELLKLLARTPADVDLVKLAQALTRDVASTHRRRDSARLLQLARAYAAQPIELGGIEPGKAMACRWSLLGPSLNAGLLESARTLVRELAPLLDERAPRLRPWLDAAIEHAGRIPVAVAEDLPVLVADEGTVAWSFPGSLETSEEFRHAVLAASVLLHPVVLADRVAKHLAGVPASDRAEHAAVALPIVRLRALEAAAAGDREALRATLAGLASLCAHHPDGDALGLALRLASQLEPGTSADDLRAVARVLEAAVTQPELESLALVVFEGLCPRSSRLREIVIDLGCRLFERTGSAAAWGHAFAVWREDDASRAVPQWLADAHRSLLDSGELVHWLVSIDETSRRTLLGDLDAFAWEPMLELVEQLWDRVSPFEYPWLSTLVVECLAVPEEDPLHDQRRSSRPVTVKQLRKRIAGLIHGMGMEVPDMLLDLHAELRYMSPRAIVPASMVEALELTMAHGTTGLGPRQRDFIERMAERMLPHSRELLHLMLHEVDFLREGGRWIDAYLGPDAPIVEVISVADMVWRHDWPVLGADMMRRVEDRAQQSLDDLATVFISLVRELDGPLELTKRLAQRLVEADEAGHDVNALALLLSRRFAPRPKRRTKKKAASKKTASKKTASKKTASKKTASKKAASKKAASKKAASKKAASKKAASKKAASKKAASKKAASKKAAVSRPVDQMELSLPRTETPTS